MSKKNIHFVWIGVDIPSYALHNIELFRQLNPEYTVKIHDENTDLHPLLECCWSDDLDPASKSDLIRYSVLHREGGWYFDCDFYPIRPLMVADTGWAHDHRCIVSKQQGHRSGAATPYANSPLWCEKGDQGMFQIIANCAKSKHSGRMKFGPPIINETISSNPRLFNVVNAGWFFPLAIGEVSGAYSFLKNKDFYKLDLCSPGCGGQLPIAAHLWACANDLDGFQVERQKIAVVQSQVKEKCLDYISVGLENLGYKVIRSQRAMHFGKILPDLLVCWNGIRDTSWSKYSKEHGVPVLYAEYGFFNRGSNYQVDHKGILQHSSWANDFDITDEDHDRLNTLCSPCPVRARETGNILILGQISGDTQLIGAEITGPAPLVRCVSRSLPPGTNAVYRPHPQDQRVSSFNWPGITIDDVAASEMATRRDDYSKTMQGTSLEQSLKDARFCIAINSNALVEATVAGIPCLAFGPSLGLNAGVYHKTSLRTLTDDIKEMLDGWQPTDSDVTCYLATLAARQYGPNELTDPATVKRLIEQAGVCCE